MHKNVFNKIDEVILSSDIESDDSIFNAFIREENFDELKINNLSEKNYKKILFLLKATINEEKDTRLLDKASNLFKEALNKNLDKPISFLKDLLATNKFSVQYRNLDKLSIENIRDIIKDQNLIELIEKLEEDEKS